MTKSETWKVRVEKVLLDWFQEVHKLNYLKNRDIITEKEKQIATHLNINEFCGSTGWLEWYCVLTNFRLNL